MRTQRVIQTFRHGRQRREEDARDIAVPAAVLATLHAAQADEVLADHAGERVPGTVGACLQVGQDDLAGRLRRRQDMPSQQVRQICERELKFPIYRSHRLPGAICYFEINNATPLIGQFAGILVISLGYPATTTKNSLGRSVRTLSQRRAMER